MTKLCGGISNVFISKGEGGKVLEIKASERIGEEISFTNVIRNGLAGVPGAGKGKELGMGGVFKMHTGGAKGHCNPPYEYLPPNYYDKQLMRPVKDFLKRFSFPSPLLCFSTFWTGEPVGPGDLNLRPNGEHTHFWRELETGEYDHNHGGHLYGDFTPKEVSYTGYFNLAEEIYRFWDAIEQKLADDKK